MKLRLRKQIVVEELNNMLVTGAEGAGKTALLRSVLHSSIYYDRPQDTGYWIVDVKGNGEFDDFTNIPFVHIVKGWDLKKQEELFKTINSVQTDDENFYKHNVLIIDGEERTKFMNPTTLPSLEEYGVKYEGCDWAISPEEDFYNECNIHFDEYMQIYDEECYNAYCATLKTFVDVYADKKRDSLDRTLTLWISSDINTHNHRYSKVSIQYNTYVGLHNPSLYNKRLTEVTLADELNFLNIASSIESKGVIAVYVKDTAETKTYRVPFLPFGKKGVE